MKVQFLNVLFDTEDFRFSAVKDETLIIVTTKGEIELEFNYEEEALEAQAELRDVLNEITDTSIVDVVTDVADTVSGLLGGLFGRASAFKAKVSKTSKDKSQEVEDFITKLVTQLDEAISKTAERAEPVAPDAAPRSKQTAADADSVFGTTRTVPSADDVTISTLSDAQLRNAIDIKAAFLIEHDTQVRALVANLRNFHTDDEVEDVIKAHKEQVFNVARYNDHLTLNEVIASILR